MAGYNGFSMSHNAAQAYVLGLMPLSKWTKSEILDRIEDIIYRDKLDLQIESLKKLNLSTLKEKFLVYSEWHHTSKYFAKTDFYCVDEEFVVNLTNEDVTHLLELQKKEKSEHKSKKVVEEPQVFCICEFLVWGGSRKHPQASTKTRKGFIKGNWFFLPDGTKKSIFANGFQKVMDIKTISTLSGLDKALDFTKVKTKKMSKNQAILDIKEALLLDISCEKTINYVYEFFMNENDCYLEYKSYNGAVRYDLTPLKDKIIKKSE